MRAKAERLEKKVDERIWRASQNTCELVNVPHLLTVTCTSVAPDTVPIDFVQAVSEKDLVNPEAGPSHCPGKPLPTFWGQLPPLQEKY